MLLSTHYKRKLWILGPILFICLVFPMLSIGEYSFNADEISAKSWMKLETENRAYFLLGFLAGLEHVSHAEGRAIAINRSLSVNEMSSQVYRELLTHPELREGPIGPIIVHTLNFEIIDVRSGPQTCFARII